MEAPKLGAGPPVISPKQIGTLGKPQTQSDNITVALEPISNVPGQLMISYEDQLKTLAPSRQLKIVSADDPAADYRLKVYLSAVGDSSSTLLIYVLDIFDRNNVRVHRISGQIPAPGSNADPWSAMTEGAINTAANKSIDALGNWLRG